jgi:group I intron endonuclease
MESGIYKITHIESNKTYVGQSENINRRLNAHKNWFKNPTRIINRHLYNYAKAYTIDDFSFEIIEYCEIDLLDEKELYWYDIYKHNTFNARPEPVSNRGLIRGKEDCDINSQRRKEYYSNPENLSKHRDMLKKRSENPKWIKGINDAAKKRAADPEWRRKQKEIVNGKERADKIRIKNFNTGYSNCVAMLDRNDNMLDYFLNVQDASKSIGKGRSNISSCLTGKLGTAYGYKWKYLTNEEYLILNGGEILKKECQVV